jgi:hypothetical protein
MYNQSFSLLSVLVGTLALVSACDGPVDTQSDDFVARFDRESLEETTLRRVGPVALENLDRYVLHLGEHGGDTIDASVALLDELDWPYAMNVEEYVWYPRGWYASGCDSIDSLAEFESCILENRALDLENSPTHQAWLAEYLELLPSVPPDSSRSGASNSTTCRCQLAPLHFQSGVNTTVAMATSQSQAEGSISVGGGGVEIGGEGSGQMEQYTITWVQCGVKVITIGELCVNPGAFSSNRCKREACQGYENFYPTSTILLETVGPNGATIHNSEARCEPDLAYMDLLSQVLVQECPKSGNVSSPVPEGSTGGSGKGDGGGGTSVGGSEGEPDGFSTKGG